MAPKINVKILQVLCAPDFQRIRIGQLPHSINIPRLFYSTLVHQSLYPTLIHLYIGKFRQ